MEKSSNDEFHGGMRATNIYAQYCRTNINNPDTLSFDEWLKANPNIDKTKSELIESEIDLSLKVISLSLMAYTVNDLINNFLNKGDKSSAVANGVEGGSNEITAPQKVIGHYPEYLELSTDLNTKPFSIPENIWNKMTPAEQWAANQKFLDRAISKGTEFILATPIDKVRPGSYLQKEIQYLMLQGYKLSSDGTKLIK